MDDSPMEIDSPVDIIDIEEDDYQKIESQLEQRESRQSASEAIGDGRASDKYDDDEFEGSAGDILKASHDDIPA